MQIVNLQAVKKGIKRNFNLFTFYPTLSFSSFPI
jgi:hypothetical protein